jgi:hypothetical protein
MNAIAETHPNGPSRVNVRAFLAGGGASTALIAATVVAFIAIGAYVGFNGLPFGGGGEDQAAVEIAAPSGAPGAAAAALARTPRAVAARPAAATAVAAPGGPGAPGAQVEPETTPGVAPGGGTVTTSPGGTTQTGVLGGAVNDLENTAGDLGLDLPLNEGTGPLTGQLDNTTNDTLNGVGGAIGSPNLGDQATGDVNGVTGNLVGKSGLTD